MPPNTTFFTTIRYHIFGGVVELWIQLFTWIHHFLPPFAVDHFSNSEKCFEKCCICSISSTLYDQASPVYLAQRQQYRSFYFWSLEHMGFVLSSQYLIALSVYHFATMKISFYPPICSSRPFAMPWIDLRQSSRP